MGTEVPQAQWRPLLGLQAVGVEMGEYLAGETSGPGAGLQPRPECGFIFCHVCSQDGRGLASLFSSPPESGEPQVPAQVPPDHRLVTYIQGTKKREGELSPLHEL